MSELRNAFRGLRSAPLVTGVVVLTLGLGIGGTTAIFSVVNGVLIKPLPYPESDALVRIVHSIGGIDQPYFSDAIYFAYVDNAQAFQDLGVWSPRETATITGQGDPEEVNTLTASRGVLTTLRVRPEIGRWFSTADDTPRAADTVIITSGYWHRRFAGDRNVLEQALTINGRSHQIIGVMPPDFRFDNEFEIVLPLRIERGAPIPGFRLLGVARLKPGVTLAQANADVARMLPIWLENPAVRAQWAPGLRPLKEDVVGDVGRTLWVLMGAIGVVLLMACANVANLLLVRGDGPGCELDANCAAASRREPDARAVGRRARSGPRLRRPARTAEDRTREPAPSVRNLDRRCRRRFRGDDFAYVRVALRTHPDPQACWPATRGCAWRWPRHQPHA
jgi:putative ABC transport system permease protein